MPLLRGRPRAWLAGLVLLALVAALFAPSLAWLARSWAVHPYYTHGPLVPLVALALAWRARAALAGGRPSDAGLILIAAGVALHLAARPWALQPLSAAALVLVLAGLVLLAAGWQGLRAMALPLALLLLAVPLPWVERLAPPLAGWVARWAALSVGALGVGVVQTGAELAVADGSFVVGAPCSGLRAIVALVTLAAVFAGFSDGPLRRRLLLVALALPLALAANWLRLTGLLWMSDLFGAARGLAFFHGPSSPLLFLAATGALIAAGRAMGCDVRAPA